MRSCNRMPRRQEAGQVHDKRRHGYRATHQPVAWQAVPVKSGASISSYIVCLEGFRQGLLARAATELAHVLRERNGDDLERLSHRWVNMDHINEVISGGPKA